MTSTKQLFTCGLALATAAVTAHADTVYPFQLINVSDQTTAGALNSVDASTLTGEYIVRSRQTTAEDDKQIVSYMQFDMWPLLLSTANHPNFAALFRIDYVSRLNDINSATVLLGRHTGAAWDQSGSNNPLHDAAYIDETGTVVAADTRVLLAEVTTTAPTVNSIEVDVTDIVKGWANGDFANHGLVLLIDGNTFQGAGFANAEIELALVPEPGSLALMALGTLMMARRRRN